MEQNNGTARVTPSCVSRRSPTISTPPQEATMKLRSNEPCPIHRSLFCCGREQMRRPTRLKPGVRRVEDPHHPRGYRELRSPAEMRKLLNRKIVEQNQICPICLKEFTDYNDVVPYAHVGIRHRMPTFRICRLDGFALADANVL
jgi:hypothetical protein